MKRSVPSQGPGLFDLPLDSPAPRSARIAVPAARVEPRAAIAAPAGPVGLPRLVGDRELVPLAAGIPARMAAGGADLAILALAVAVVALGTRWLGHQGPWNWQPFGLFLLAFSFLYAVVPLAFWGQTPGMAWRRLVARSLDGDALSFGQTFRRWLGGILTVAMAGLPTFLALAGRRGPGGGQSLADLVSGSRTCTAPAREQD